MIYVVCQFRFVQCVEVQVIYIVGQQFVIQFGCQCCCQQIGVVVLGCVFKGICYNGWNVGVVGCCEFVCVVLVFDWQNVWNDWCINVCFYIGVVELEKCFGFEKELGDGVVGVGVNFVFQLIDVGLSVCGFRVFFWISVNVYMEFVGVCQCFD